MHSTMHIQYVGLHKKKEICRAEFPSEKEKKNCRPERHRAAAHLPVSASATRRTRTRGLRRRRGSARPRHPAIVLGSPRPTIINNLGGAWIRQPCPQTAHAGRPHTSRLHGSSAIELASSTDQHHMARSPLLLTRNLRIVSMLKNYEVRTLWSLMCSWCWIIALPLLSSNLILLTLM